MESHGDNTDIRRVVLPSGKTIEVAYIRSAGARDEEPRAEPQQDLHICLECESDLVYPIEWEEAGKWNWALVLRCPNCQTTREGVFDQSTLERFDEQVDLGTDALTRAYKSMVRANMSEEIDRFEAALHADAILPEDF